MGPNTYLYTELFVTVLEITKVHVFGLYLQIQPKINKHILLLPTKGKVLPHTV